MPQSAESPKPAPAGRASRLLAWLRWLVRGLFRGLTLLVVAIVAALIGWLNSEDFQRRATALVEALVEDQTGEQLTVNRVTINVLPPAIDVHGFHLFHQPTGDTIASVERLRVPLVLRDGGVRIGRLQLQAPVVQLHIAKDGRLRELRDLKRAENPRPLTELPWSSIELRDGTFRLFWPDGSVALTDIHITPDDLRTSDLHARLDLRLGGLRQTATLDWAGLMLGPREIRVPALRIATEALALDGRLAWPLTGDLDADLAGQLDLEAINDLFEPPRAVHGLVDLDLRVDGTPADPSLTVALYGTSLELEMPGKATPVMRYRFGDVALGATAQRDRVDIDRLAMSWADGTLLVTGWVDPNARYAHDVRVVGTNVSLARALRALDTAPNAWVDLRADAEIAVDGPLDPLALSGRFDLAVSELLVTRGPVLLPTSDKMLDIPSAWADGRIQLTKDHIVLDAERVQSPRNRGNARVDIGFASTGPLDVSFNLDRADLRDFQPLNGVGLTGAGQISGRLAGPFTSIRFDGSGVLNDFSVLGIPYADRLEVHSFSSPTMKSLVLEGARATVGDTVYGGDFALDFGPGLRMDTDLIVETGRIQDLVGMFIDLPGMTGDLRGSLSLHGPLNDLDGAAHFALADVDLWGEHFETGEAHGYMDAGLFTLDDLRVLRRNRTEGLFLRGSVGRAWALNMELLGDGFDVGTLTQLADVDTPLTGRAAAHAVIDNTLFEPNPSGRISIANTRVAGEPVDDSDIWFETTNGVMTWSGVLLGGAITIDATQGLYGEQPYDLNVGFDRVPAHVFHPVAADGRPIRATATGSMHIAGHFGASWSPVALEATLDEVDVGWAGRTLRNPRPWGFTLDGDAFTLDDISLAGVGTALNLFGTGGDGLTLTGGGTADLAWVRAFVPGVKRSEGSARVDIQTQGKVPNMEALIFVDGVASLLSHEAIPAAFEDVRFAATLGKDAYIIDALDGNIGGGTVHGEGRVDARDWSPARWDLEAQIRNAQIQWIDDLPPAIGDAKLSFDGPTGALLLSGDVAISEMLFSDRITWEDWVVSFREEIAVAPTTSFLEEPWFSFDVRIDAPRTIRLRNNVADGIASAELHLVGDTTRPGLVGSVRIEDALAILQGREFRVDRGDIVFDDPWTWDPRLDFNLVTDIMSREQRYRVQYDIFGPFSDWRTASRSDPSLPQADVNALLWFGITTEDLEEMGELPAAIAQGVADLVLADLFSSTQVGELAEVPDLLFDRIDVATGVNARGEYSPEPRLVVEKRLDDLGGVNLRWEFNLGRPEDNYVRAEKRVGGVWSLAGWYATMQRDRVLPIGGAYGIDVTARWEIE